MGRSISQGVGHAPAHLAMDANHLTRRCSRRLAGLFPPFFVIKTHPEIASRALASRG